MGVRERRRSKQKEKAAEKSVEEEASLPEMTAELEHEPTKEVHRPEVEIKKDQTSAIEVTEPKEVASESVVVEVKEEQLSPPWGSIDETEWMYSIPPRGEDKGLWAAEWGDFILQWSEANKTHIISLTVFIREYPFKDILRKTDAFKIIGSKLVDDNVAVWKDRRKHQLRVYWRPLEDWADIMYNWALSTGTLRLDLQTIIIQHADQDFASLPEEDIEQVLKIMVERDQAEWVDKKKSAIKIIV